MKSQNMYKGRIIKIKKQIVIQRTLKSYTSLFTAYKCNFLWLLIFYLDILSTYSYLNIDMLMKVVSVVFNYCLLRNCIAWFMRKKRQMNKEEKSRVENYLLGFKWLVRIKNWKDDKSYWKKNVAHSLLNIQVELLFFLNRYLSFAHRNEENDLQYLSDGFNFFSFIPNRTYFASFLSMDCIREHWFSCPFHQRNTVTHVGWLLNDKKYHLDFKLMQ